LQPIPLSFWQYEQTSHPTAFLKASSDCIFFTSIFTSYDRFFKRLKAASVNPGPKPGRLAMRRKACGSPNFSAGRQKFRHRNKLGFAFYENKSFGHFLDSLLI
jgi:hypothetical protein